MIAVEGVRTLDFRNLAAAELRLGNGVTLLHGPNGAGKTNLLEALYAALVGRSCRTNADRETIAFGAALSRAETGLTDGGERRELLYSCGRAEGRRHLLNGSSVPAGIDELRPPVAVFMPDRLDLVKGPPSGRRAHLDGFLAAIWPSRSEHRRRYSRALAQRNALVGRIRAGRATADSLDAWDRELAEAGVELMAVRTAAADKLSPLFAQAATDLGLAEDGTLAYAPRSHAADADELATELGDRRESDLARGFTGHGPHLDDLKLAVAGRSLRRYGSQGQQRAGLLALLFAERDALLEERREPPLMLLDDVTSELDPERRERLCERLVRGGGQALVTATEAAHLPESCPRLEVAVRSGGTLVPVDGGASTDGATEAA